VAWRFRSALRRESTRHDLEAKRGRRKDVRPGRPRGRRS
jgi:hypothetical protein